MAKLFVGCKLPHGLTLEIIAPQADENGKPLNVMHPRPPGPRVVLNGSNSVNDKRIRMAVSPVYGKTLVEEEFWNKWLSKNKDAVYITNGAVFAAKDEKEFDAKANAGISVLGGFEPINPGVEMVSDDGVVVKADESHLKALRAGPR